MLIGLATAALCTLPYVRFQLTHGNEVNAHLQLLGSYWTQDLPLSAKLTRAVQAYLDGGRRA